MRKFTISSDVAEVTKFIAMAIVMVMLVSDTLASSCPATCHCAKKRVSCEHKDLQYVPKGIPNNTLYLYIGWNSITRIQADDLSSLVNLETLSLKKNEIYKIEEGAFKNNNKLKTVFLTSNVLTNTTAEVFHGLSSLEKLYLTQNRLTGIPDLKYAMSLKKLNLDTNKITDATFPSGYEALQNLGQVILTNNPGITKIKATTFKNIRNAPITKISLGRCSITEIANNSFSELQALQSLSIGYNKISEEDIKGFIEGMAGSGIHFLDMSGVFQNLAVLPSGTFSVLNDVPLFQLRLAHSDIRVLQKNCFQNLTQLTLLDLSYAGITTAEDGAFKGLKSLQVLELYHNRFAVIPSQLPHSLKELDISHNSDIGELPDNSFIDLRNLTELRIHHCSIVQIHSRALWGVENLQILDLSYNQIGGNNIGVMVMEKLKNLSSLYLQGNRFRTINKESKLFVGLSNLTLLDMSNSQCSELSNGLFHPLTKLKILQLDKNSLGHQLSGDNDGSTFAGLLNLNELHLEDNGITTLPAALFKDLRSLQTLSLKNNQLYHWDPQLFQPLLKVTLADLSMNQISVINETSLLYIRPSMHLNLTRNPFNCGCDLVWFRRWISGNNKTLLNLTTYTCESPAKMEGRPLMEFNPDKIWMSCHWLEILYACIGSVFFLTAVSSGIMYRYRWKIMVQYYFVRRYFRLLKKQGEGDDAQLVIQTAEYDAILSSDDEDVDFVEYFLLPNISTRHTEEGIQGASHRICYPKGDIEWGQHTSQFAEMAHPDTSSKMLVVLSEKYMQTLSKADFELGVARFRRQKEGRQVIVIIFIGTPELEAKLPADIRMLLDDQSVRWEKKWQKNVEKYKDAIEASYEQIRDLLDRPALRNSSTIQA